MVTPITRANPPNPTTTPMKPSLIPLFASLLSAASLHAQDPGAPPPPGIPAPANAPQPPQPPQLSGPGERGPHQLDLPPGHPPRPQQLRRPNAPQPQGPGFRRPNAPQPAPAISPRAIANIEQMARAKEAEGHPDEAMELRQLIGSLRSPQGPRQANRPPQPSQPFPAVPNAHGMTAPARPNADIHQKLQSFQHQLMALRNELNALRHQTAQPPAPHTAPLPLHSSETLKRIAKARLEAPHGPPATNDGSLKDQIKTAVRDLLEKRFADLRAPKKLKELRKDSPDVKKQRKSKEKPESKDAPKHDAPKDPEADSHKKDDDHKEDHKEEPKAEHKDHDDDRKDDHKEEHKGGEKEEPKED